MDKLVKEITDKLEKSFGEQVMIDFQDEKNDGKHFFLTIESEKFVGLSKVEQSKLVYKALDGCFRDDKIHALRMRCIVPKI